MKNGTLFNKLVMVDSSDRRASNQDGVDDAAVDYPYEAQSEAASAINKTPNAHYTLLIFMAVSIACTTAAIATGSYAIWLSRQQAARQALTDVNDILKSCQSRMQQLEADVQRLPG